MRIVGMIVGWLLVAISALFLAAAIGDLLRGPTEARSGRDISVGIGLFFAIVGYLGFRLATARGSGPTPASPEQRILSAAARLGGKVTLAETVLHAGVTVAEAKDLLSSLARQGLAELQLTDEGQEVYAFGGLVQGDKESAKSPFAT